MEANDLDIMVVSGRGDEFMRGRVQYVSDVFQWAGWGFVVLPQEGDAIFVGDPLGGFDDGSPKRWVAEVVLSQEPGAVLAGLISDFSGAASKVGIAGLADITAAAHLAALELALPSARIVDATEIFDDFRATKSLEEIASLEETSDILRSVFAALEAEIRPGVLERDILSEAHRLCRQFGCVDGIALIGRAPMPGFGWGSDAAIGSDDVVVIDLEWGGPSGYWLELRRCFSFGEPPPEVRRYWEARVEAFDACADVMQPGVSSDEILAARDRVYLRYGLTAGEEVRYTAHGIGIDSLEPPWAPGRERTLQEGMVLSLHPNVQLTASEAERFGPVSVGDSVLVTQRGGRCLTYPAVEWVVLDA